LQHRIAVASLILLALMFVAGLLAHRIAPYGYQDVNLHALNSGPSWAHPFGADQLGRDYLSRTLYGIGTSAKVALLVGFLATLIGTVIGALAGYYGGLVDNVLMRLTDLLLTLPVLAVVLLAAAFLHADTAQKAAIVIACLLWTSVARVLRASALSLREKEFVASAHASGASDLRVILRHILPNAIAPLAAAASLLVATAIVLEVTIAYLGFGFSSLAGLQAKPSIGDVLRQAQTEGFDHWWGITFPGLPIVAMVVAISFLAEGLRDSLDPAAGSGRRMSARAFRPRRHRRVAPALRRLTAPIRAPERLGLERFRQVGRPRLPRASMLSARRRSRNPYATSRRRASLKFGLEALAIAILIGAVAGSIYHFGVHHSKSPWAAAGSNEQALSGVTGAQTEVSVAVAPDDPRRFFAASNDSVLPQLRLYDSTDGGRTWKSRLGPLPSPYTCAWGDPAVALAPGGKQYVAFTMKSICRKGPGLTPYLVVASRPGPNAPWIVRRVAPPANADGFDDKPAIAVDGTGRVYVVWSRLQTLTYETTVLSTSDDGGRTWSPPHTVDPKLESPQLVSAVGGAGRTVSLAGVDAGLGIWIARSTDGGRHFAVRQAAPLPVNNAAGCVRNGKYLFAQQSILCLGPNPTVTVSGSRTYVTYAFLSANQAWDVGVAVFDAKLRPLWHGRIGPPEKKPADQFWPISATDASTGELWACFYDTTGDSERKQAWFLCTRSRDGRHWSTPVRVAQQAQDAFVLWADAMRAGFGDQIAYGGYPGLAVVDGVAHPMWIDARNRSHLDQEIFTARVSSAAVSAAAPPG
jgi:ABC-type dipeptide/oligopeptide/nickel transport system permease subunit